MITPKCRRIFQDDIPGCNINNPKIWKEISYTLQSITSEYRIPFLDAVLDSENFGEYYLDLAANGYTSDVLARPKDFYTLEAIKR